MPDSGDIALAVAVPVGTVALLAAIIIATICTRRARDRKNPEAKDDEWAVERDEILDDRDWMPLDAGYARAPPAPHVHAKKMLSAKHQARPTNLPSISEVS